jgi:predicted nuclease of predicted toxin-antitoxin system
VAKYLIDANLPYYFSLWRGPTYLHLKDVNDSMSDEELWTYARQGDWTIVTKDAMCIERAIHARVDLRRLPPRNRKTARALEQR